MVEGQSQGVRSHPQRSECGGKSIARCAQTRNLTKVRRDCSKEQIEEGSSGKNSLESSLKVSECKIRS
jgi:hypothetical protein